MSKLLSIPLSILILFQSFNIHIVEVLRLNELLEHAQLHKERYGDGVLTFLSKHYGSLKKSHEKQHQEEEREHNHLPMHHDCGTQISTSFVVSTHSFSLEDPKQDIDRTANFYYQDKFSTFEKQQVFQPPKLT